MPIVRKGAARRAVHVSSSSYQSVDDCEVASFGGNLQRCCTRHPAVPPRSTRSHELATIYLRPCLEDAFDHQQVTSKRDYLQWTCKASSVIPRNIDVRPGLDGHLHNIDATIFHRRHYHSPTGAVIGEGMHTCTRLQQHLESI